MHVLVVHSDPRFYREVKPLLHGVGASGAYQSSLTGIRHQIEAQFPDLILLERRCFAQGSSELGLSFTFGHRLPVIFLTTATAQHICAGEERNRISAMLVHLQQQIGAARSAKVLQIGHLRIHSGRMRVAMNGQWIRLPPIQFRILYHLAVNANELVPHRDLMLQVWGYEGTDDDARDLLKVHIRQLRRKLGEDFQDYIQAVRGQGYVLVDPSADE